MTAAGIEWRMYQDMADNFTDNPLVGFAAFRDAHAGHGDAALKARALTTRKLDALKADVLAGTLPQVSYVIAPAAASEHPSPSSPAQGAAYVAEVIDALTADPKVWARTVLLVMFDENDGFFDHVPPPAPPSIGADGAALGGSTVDLAGEYHRVPSSGDHDVDVPDLRGRPYGLGPRVPLYAVSPWSRGGWVNSQVFDHTSVIRFLETRFGFEVPNISPWRRAVCGDLTSCFDFTAPNAAMPVLPDIRQDAARAAALSRQISPAIPAASAPWQEPGIRHARPTPYRFEVERAAASDGVRLRFIARGEGGVLHVYDRNALDRAPRRYTIGKGGEIEGSWPFDRHGRYDLWILGPGGFHRHFSGTASAAGSGEGIAWSVDDDGVSFSVPEPARSLGLTVSRLLPGGGRTGSRPIGTGRHLWPFVAAMGWYDLTVASADGSSWRCRLAGRHDRSGVMTISDPFV